MVFHARKWGWKRIAARLLLVPMLTGASAAVAHAQFNPVPMQAKSASLPAASPAGDAKAMLKEGRKALKAGQYDRAQDLARAADANNPGKKWGLFDDTPNALLKDVQAAVAKAQQHEAEQLVKQAKILVAKPAPGARPSGPRTSTRPCAWLSALNSSTGPTRPGSWATGPTSSARTSRRPAAA